jgi:hypothetical protein
MLTSGEGEAPYSPPKPIGCEWRKVDGGGWNLWRNWSEKDPATGQTIKKSRFAGHLPAKQWDRMSKWDPEVFDTVVREQLRRYDSEHAPLESRVFEAEQVQEEKDSFSSLAAVATGDPGIEEAGEPQSSSTGKKKNTSTGKSGAAKGAKKEIASTGKPSLRLVSDNDFSSTGKKPKLETQLELINTNSSKWKRRPGKPPYPPKHEPSAHGKLDIGRRRLVGWQLLRRVPCTECGGRVRPVVGYISPTAMIGLEREDYETKVGIVRNILRRTATRNIFNLRCPRCESGGARIGLPDSKPA